MLFGLSFLLGQNYNKLKNYKHTFDRLYLSGNIRTGEDIPIKMDAHLISAMLPDSFYAEPCEKPQICYSYVWNSYSLLEFGCPSEGGGYSRTYKILLKDLLIENNILHIIGVRECTLSAWKRPDTTTLLWFHLVFNLKHKFKKTFFKKIKFIEFSPDSLFFSASLYNSPKYEGGLREIKEILAKQDTIPRNFIEAKSESFHFSPKGFSYSSFKMGKKGWKRIYGLRFFYKYENQLIMGNYVFILNKKKPRIIKSFGSYMFTSAPIPIKAYPNK